jgi:hypothetical protein
MKRVSTLASLSLEESLAYIGAAHGDELTAAFALAVDRSALAGELDVDPDAADIHHALFLLRRARGLGAPSYDLLRLQLRGRVAA